MNKNKIRTIITAASGLDNLVIPASVTQIVYPVKDSKTENIQIYFDECYKTIEKSKLSIN